MAVKLKDRVEEAETVEEPTVETVFHYDADNPVTFTLDLKARPSIKTDDKELGSAICADVPIKHIYPYLFPLGTGGNPRGAKENAVVKQIRDTLSNNPEKMVFRNKGLLASVSRAALLAGNTKIAVTADDPSLHGIVDGGHTSFAIRKQVLSCVIPEENPDRKSVERIRHPSRLRAFEEKYAAAIQKFLPKLQGSVNVEFIYPKNSAEAPKRQILDVIVARNAGSEQTVTAINTYDGVYDDLRNALPPSINARINWKPDEAEIKDEIKVREVITLAMVALYGLYVNRGIPRLDRGEMVTPGINFYNSKAGVQKAFRAVKVACSPSSGDDVFSASTDKGFLSALALVPDIMRLHDWLVKEFTQMYRKSGKYARSATGYTEALPNHPFRTYYFQEPMHETIKGALPAYILPLLYPVHHLMKLDRGKLVWRENPVEFYDTMLSDYITKKYMKMIKDRFYNQDDGFTARAISNSPRPNDFFELVSLDIELIIKQSGV